MGYRYIIDPRAKAERERLAQRGKDIADLGGVMRWALHMSHKERDFLQRANRDFSMDQFIKAPESRAFMIGTKA